MRKTDPLLQFAVAAALLTRLPLPRLPDRAFGDQARAVWAFPLIGAGIGALSGVIGRAALDLNLPVAMAAGLVLVVQICLTGAMHEDGLADTADGLWGGMTRARRLEIMHDSRIGTYGVLALIIGVGLRWTALTTVLPHGIGAIVVAAVISRGFMPVLMIALPHARSDGLSKAVGRPPVISVAIAGTLATFIGGAIAPGLTLPAICAAGCCIALLGWIARSRIGGQTGDILGAAQFLGDLAALTTFAMILQK